MRIISGKNGGQIIKIPKKFKLRPTTDRSKEGIFNIISNFFDYENLIVLDLFSGTGNISYEFASRGTNNITVVDSNTKHVKFIKSQSEKFNFKFNIIKTDVFRYLRSCNNNDCNYDIIFADPPYNLDLNKYENIIYKIFEFKLLKNDGIIIIEHSNKIRLDSIKTFYMKRKYGGCFFSFFKYLKY